MKLCYPLYNKWLWKSREPPVRPNKLNSEGKALYIFSPM